MVADRRQVWRRSAASDAPTAEARAHAAEGGDDDEASWIEAAARGDDDAFARLFRRHADRVRTHLTRLVGPVPERDDLVQKVFVALAGALATYRGDGALSTYLHRVTVNIAYDHLRVRKRRRLGGDQPSQVGPAAGALAELGGPSPEDQLGARADLTRLLALLDYLSPKKRTAFVLVAIEGQSLAEAAALIGAREEAVKQRVLAARREILAMMERQNRSIRQEQT
jgi:RNA polymerase sigma-70 factor (ECF subfamily)